MKQKVQSILHSLRARPGWQQFLLIFGGFLMLFGAPTLGIISAMSGQQIITSTTNVNAKLDVTPPKPTKIAAPLTGVKVDTALAQRPVVGVMIENSLEARPQSGLKNAGVVVEVIAEGGITRFFALYQETSPKEIGPVRSARPYYLDFALAFDAGYAHVGGSPQALSQIRSRGVRDLDQFSNAGAYWRSNQRFAPHNVYTNSKNLRTLMSQKGYKTSTFKALQRKDDAPATKPTATNINLDISSYLYNVRYNYDKSSNTYKRTMGEQPHNDANGVQIAPKTVVAIVTDHGYSGQYSTYRTTGSGTAFIFQDGKVVKGKWARKSGQTITFTNSGGKVIEFNRGQMWITLVGSASYVRYN